MFFLSSLRLVFLKYDLSTGFIYINTLSRSHTQSHSNLLFLLAYLFKTSLKLLFYNYLKNKREKLYHDFYIQITRKKKN